MMIETENLTKRFRGHNAVNGVSLKVPEGSAFALIGANGAGKTTTLRLLVNILSPDSGSARIRGTVSQELSHGDFQRIGYVSENQKLPERLSVAQYFDYLRALYASWDRELEKELRRKLHLPADRKLGKLSHGMRMKTMLIGALSFRPALLILDEPLSGLDPLVRDEMMEGLLRQADETTIVISSHELSEIESFTTHVAFMDEGRIQFQESIESLSARFREISLVLADAASGDQRLPNSWLQQERAGTSFRFVDTAFSSAERLSEQLSRHLGRIDHFESRPLSLREISKVLMRAARKESQP